MLALYTLAAGAPVTSLPGLTEPICWKHEAGYLPVKNGAKQLFYWYHEATVSGDEAVAALAQRRAGLLVARRHVHRARPVRRRCVDERHAQPVVVEQARERHLRRAAGGRGFAPNAPPTTRSRRRTRSRRSTPGRAPGAQGPALLHRRRVVRRPLRPEHGARPPAGQRREGGRREDQPRRLRRRQRLRRLGARLQRQRDERAVPCALQRRGARRRAHRLRRRLHSAVLLAARRRALRPGVRRRGAGGDDERDGRLDRHLRHLLGRLPRGRAERLPTQAFTLLAERHKQLARHAAAAPARGRRAQTVISPIFPTCAASYSAEYDEPPATSRRRSMWAGHRAEGEMERLRERRRSAFNYDSCQTTASGSRRATCRS